MKKGVFVKIGDYFQLGHAGDNGKKPQGHERESTVPSGTPELYTRDVVRSRFLDPAGKLFKSAMASPPRILADFDIEMRVKSDFLVEHVKHQTIMAVQHPVFVLPFSCAGDSALTLSEVNFVARTNNKGQELHVIPASDDPTSKEFLVFVDPPIMPGGPPLHMEVRHQWPKASLNLEKVGVWDKHAIHIPDWLESNLTRLTIRVELEGDGAYEFDARFNAQSESKTDKSYSCHVDNIARGTYLVFRIRRR